LALFALVIDEEHPRKKEKKYVPQAWMNREVEGELATLYKELVDDETKFSY
jgi:hypothetical protein